MIQGLAQPSEPAIPRDDLSASVTGNLDRLDDAPFVGLGPMGTGTLTEAQRAILRRPADIETEVDVLPTGEVYVSHVHVRQVLNEAFGPTGWGMLPTSMPKLTTRERNGKQSGTIMQHYALMAGGRPIAFAWGQSDYHPTNDRMTEADALEAAKSNAITRCSKDLGIFREIWNRRFTDRYLHEYCVLVLVDGYARWRRIDARPFDDEQPYRERPQRLARGQQQQTTQDTVDRLRARGGEKISRLQAERLHQIARDVGANFEVIRAELKQRGYAKAEDILKRDYDAIVAFIEGQRRSG